MKVLIKSMKPHRQRVLTADGEEVRLQKWANKKAAESLRTAGGDASGEQFTQARDMLMRDAVENPEEHGLKFMNERLPFEGQNLESSLSEPDYSGEAEADFALRQEELEQAMKEGTTPNESQEDIDADKNRRPNLFDSEGKLRQTMPTEEEEEKMRQATGEPSFASKEEAMAATFDPDAEAEHMRRIMTSRQVPMRDAWSLLKEQQPYDSEGRYLEHQDINVCPEAKAFLQREMTEGPQFRDEDPNFCNNCDFCHGK